MFGILIGNLGNRGILGSGVRDIYSIEKPSLKLFVSASPR